MRKMKTLTMAEFLKHFRIRIPKSGFIACFGHPDTRPSLKIYPKERGWYCFSCHKGGGPIQLYAMMRKVNVGKAALKLGKLFTVPLHTDYLKRDVRTELKEIVRKWERNLCASFFTFADMESCPFTHSQLYFAFYTYGHDLLDRAEIALEGSQNIEVLRSYEDSLWRYIYFVKNICEDLKRGRNIPKNDQALSIPKHQSKEVRIRSKKTKARRG